MRTEQLHVRSELAPPLDSRAGRSTYRAAVAEFDRLWESGAARTQPQRMRELLQVIESFEGTRAGRSGVALRQ